MKNAQRHSNIFIFYDEKHGEQYSEIFRSHLEPLVLAGKVKIFDVGKIEAGKNKIVEFENYSCVYI